MRHYRLLGFLLLALLARMTLAAPVTSPAIHFTLKTDAKVSIAIYDQSGAIVRQLLLGAPRKAGANTAAWDGLDEKGRPAVAGNYTWKLLSSQGLKAEWMCSLGTNLTPGYQIMPGNHIGAVTIALDPNGDAYVMGGCSEVVPGMARITPAGKARWYSDHMLEANNDGGVGLADGTMFTLLTNGKVVAVDPATGKGLWKTDTKLGDGAWGPGSGTIFLAARGKQVVISHKTKNLVRWLNTADGSTLDEATIPAPQAVAIDGAGVIYALSGDAVVKFTREDKTPKTVITGLTSPWRLDADPVTGEIFVAEAGDSQQVKRFAADGKLLATYGRKGGRLFGKYEPADYKMVSDIKGDSKGGFIVVEAGTAPRRVAFFDKAGKLVHEWYGGLHYANYGTADPDNPSIMWYHSGSGQVVKAQVDYVKKSWRVLEVYQLFGQADNLYSTAIGPNMFFQIRHCRNRTYLIGGLQDPMILVVDEQNRCLRPCVSGKTDVAHDWNTAGYFSPSAIDAVWGGKALPGKQINEAPDFANRQAYIWTDLNGDMQPQLNEFVFTKKVINTWFCGRIWADNNLNLYTMDKQPMVLRPKGWTQWGAPIYGGWTDFQPLGETPKWFDAVKVSWPAGSGIVPTQDGGLLGFFNNTENPFGKGIGSEGLGGNYVVKWNKAGKALWVTGKHSPNFGCAPGEARFLWNIAGLAHDCLIMPDMQCYYEIKNLVYAWDTDGLWVGRLLDNPDLKAAPLSTYYLATENFGGSALEITAKNKVPGLNVGDVLYFGEAQNATTIYKITGWDTFQRQHGAVALSAAQANAAKLAAFKYAASKSSSDKSSKMKKYAATVLPKLAAAPNIDGKLDDAVWKKAGVVDDFRTTPGEETPSRYPVMAMVGYDDSNLYLAARVKESKLDKLRVVARQASDMVYQDDSLEFFVDCGYTRSAYYHFIVNANGVCYTGYGWGAREVKVTSKAGREPGAWTVELAIPWEQMKAKAPLAGERVGFNIVENHVTDDPMNADWSPLRGNLNHSPQYFGTLYAGDTLPRDAQALIAGNAFVKNLKDTNIVLDGAIDDWRGVRPVKIMDGAKPMADLYLGWKPDGLYAAFDVTTATPWKNAAAFEMAFNGGAACDLNIGPIIKDQKEMAPGDVRYIAAPINGTASVVEFLSKITADLTDADKAPRTYHTAAQGNNLFDRVAVLPAGLVTAKVRPDGKGYIVEMRVPLRAPLKLASGMRFKFDASLILANPEGNLATLRLPWFSTSGDDMFVATDIVMETRLRPWNWGEAELE